MQKIFITIVLVFFGVMLYAQRIPAEVKLKSGKTLNGYIEKPLKIRAFNRFFLKVEERYYEIRLENIESIITPQVTYLHKTIQYKGAEESILIASFVQGEVSLYEGFQIDGEKVFYIQRSGNPMRLIPKRGTTQFFNYFFKDCLAWRAIDEVHYQKKDLYEVVQASPSCFSKDESLAINYDPTKDRLQPSIGAIIGWQNTKLMPIFDRAILVVPQFTGANSFLVGGSFRLQKGKYLGFQQDVNFAYFNSSIPQNADTDPLIRFHFTTLEFQTLLQASFPVQKINLHAGVGINNSFYIGQRTQGENLGSLRLPDYRFQTYTAAVLGEVGMSYQLNETIYVSASYRYHRSFGLLYAFSDAQFADVRQLRHALIFGFYKRLAVDKQ